MSTRLATRNFQDAARLALLGSVGRLALAGLAVALPSHAFAQTEESASTAEAPADRGGLDEIVVTAQRRQENLQDVPISLSAITAGTLRSAGVSSTLAITQVVPSVQVTKSGLSSIFFIRGVGNTSGGTGEEGANAFYIDGVYLADLQQANTEFNNIERIEVLKGPQGTLFGRNASGGLVHIITRDPGDRFEAKGSVGLANYGTYKGQLYVATPVTDTLSVDIALTGRNQTDGFGVNLATGEDNMKGWMWGVRSKAVWQPKDEVRLVLAGDYWHSKDTYSSGFTIERNSFLAAPPGTPVGTPGTVPGPIPGTLLFGYAGDYNRNSTNPGYAEIKVKGISLTAEFDMDFASLTSITAFREMNAISNVDSDYGPPVMIELYIPSVSNTFQQEVRLASETDGPLTWQVGMFFFRARAGVEDQLTFGTLVGGADRGQLTTSFMRTQSYAGFGEATYAITPTTHLTGGIRYTREDRSLDAKQTPYNQTNPALIAAFTFSKKDSISYGQATYRAAIRQDITDDINIYASYNTGFKAGLWSLQAPAGPPVRPQTTRAFEAGMKSELFDRMLRLNVAGYQYKVDDYQVRAAPQDSANPILLNAADVKVRGIEANVELAPTRNFRVFGDFNLLDAKFETFTGAPFTYPNPAVCTPNGAEPGTSTGPATGGNLTCLGDASGNRVPLSPKFTASIGANYTLPLGGDSGLDFNILYFYNSGYYFEQDNRLKQDSFGIVNTSVQYRINETFSIEAWANNLTNKLYYIDKLASAPASRGEHQPPRTFGVNFKFDFGS